MWMDGLSVGKRLLKSLVGNFQGGWDRVDGYRIVSYHTVRYLEGFGARGGWVE